MGKYVDIKLPNELYHVVENQTVEIKTSKDREIQNDEYDTDADDIVCKVEKANQVMIRILLAGANKSHICQNMVDKGYTVLVLVVCPTNRLLHEFDSDAMPIYNMFGIIFST